MAEDPNQLPQALARDLLSRGYVALPAHQLQTIQSAATTGGQADAEVIAATLRLLDAAEASHYDSTVMELEIRALRTVLNDWQRKSRARI
jgi:hypothetical protein